MVDRDIEIDQNFFLPPNVIDLRYATKDLLGDENGDADDTLTLPADPDITWDVTSPESGTIIPVPDNITVIAQTAHAAEGGGYLIDIIIDIPDLPGVEAFDVAVAKA